MGVCKTPIHNILQKLLIIRVVNFAKAVSICGATNIERMREFKGKTQFRFYHGDIDDVIPVTYSREAYKALKTTGKKAEYIEFYGANHNAWHPAFNTPDFLQWIFKKK